MIWFFLACAQPESELSTEPQSVLSLQSKILDIGTTEWNYPASTMVPIYNEGNPQFQQAQELFSTKEYKQAAEQLLLVLKEDPKHIGAHSLLSSTFINLGDLQQAEQAARKVLELYPSSLAYSNMATVLLAAERHDEAQSYFEKALVLDGKSFLALRNLASISYRSGNLKLSEEYLHRLLRLEPNDSYIYISLGQVLAEQGRIKEAEEIYRYRLQELEFVDDGTKRTASGLSLELPLALGEVLRRQQKWDEALRWFEQTIEWSKVYPASWTLPEVYAIQAMFRMAKVYKQQGNLEQAKEVIDRAEKLFFSTKKDDHSGGGFHLNPQLFVEQRHEILYEE